MVATSHRPGDTTDASADEPSRDDRNGPFDVHTVVLGAKGGLVATGAMTAFRLPISGSLPPTADFVATYLGSGEPADYPLLGLVLHLAYGVGAGVLFASLFALRRVAPDDLSNERRGVLWGVVYGLLLSVFGVRAVLGRGLGMDLDPDERFVFHVGHVVYGLTLGTYLGSRLE